ncbi:MAG: phosphomannomutase/phosphoglucomutase [Gammaproteobacteria bacterium]|nr:phosphomannomutase/phosphoglucomutase [Gammaproteobacteria bacterium]|tara:strand:+ start:8843 stop:10213 length:1371 start_codon:yes stop_codon:yes gene_type:complete
MEITESIFREYDIRGTYPDQINEKVIAQIAYAISHKCKQESINEICVGRDGRLSGKSLLNTLSKKLSDCGINVINIDLVTTPLLYYAAKKSKFKSGIMITGSHNPKNYNGIKLVINDKPVSGSEILDLLKNNDHISSTSGKIIFKDIKDEYINEVTKNIQINKNKKIKVVIDCGNGAAGCIAPKLFNNLGCEVIELYSDIDGNFPNHHPDPGKTENLKDLISEVKNNNADLGLAFDGDGDRVGLVTNKGDVIFPDKILMMFSEDILLSKKGSIIFDVKCSSALPRIIKDLGGNPIMSPTGHFHIKNGIKKHNPLLAGEMSGHIFFNDKWYGFDDGHYSGARIIELICKKSESISEINKKLPELYSTPELNIDVTDETKFQIIEDFCSQCSLEGEKITIDGLRINFDNGWGLLRASNTTPKLVLRFEGDSKESLRKIKNSFLNELSRICPDIDINLV